jgi:hypothetical protein
MHELFPHFQFSGNVITTELNSPIIHSKKEKTILLIAICNTKWIKNANQYRKQSLPINKLTMAQHLLNSTMQVLPSCERIDLLIILLCKSVSFSVPLNKAQTFYKR